MKWRLGFVLICGLSACASTNVHHLATTNYLDRTLVPDNRVAQWALTPVWIPLGITSLAVDNVLVAPLAQAPSAYMDAHNFAAHTFEGYVSSLGLLPFQMALTPLVFAGSWTFRTFFGWEPEEEAAWSWPAWGCQWTRDAEGRLVGPPEDCPATQAPAADPLPAEEPTDEVPGVPAEAP